MTQVFRTLPDLQKEVLSRRKQGQTIGFVPTMGALHEGHLSLVKVAKESTDAVVCSIFVNPTQFNNPEDLKTYPRQLDQDVSLLETEQCDMVWAPGTEQLYQEGEITKSTDYGSLTSSLEGAFRPGHFDGVVTIVRKLFEAVQPDHAFFGQKDFQQLAIIQELGRREFPGIEITGCPIVRSPEGLALSSRNQLLSNEGRIQALVIHKVLQECRMRISIEKPDSLESWALGRLKSAQGVTPEYFKVVSRKTLEPARVWSVEDPVIALVVAYVEGVRLIDNMKLEVPT